MNQVPVTKAQRELNAEEARNRAFLMEMREQELIAQAELRREMQAARDAMTLDLIRAGVSLDQLVQQQQPK
jgi:hypothetical protein